MIRTYSTVALGALGALACSTNNGELVIVKNIKPAEGCIVPANADTAIGRGLLHPDSATGYVFTPVVQSLVETNSGTDRRVFFNGAEIELDHAGGDAVVNPFTTAFSGSVEPGATAGVAFEITPAGLAEGEYLAHIQIFGNINGGDVESQVFDYPITVSASAFAVDLGDCAALESEYAGVIAGSTCNALQDGTIECCDDGGDLICPAEGPPADDET
jgi:hypothetical protein